MTTISFGGDQEARAVLLDWWRGLDQARGERAELRRAGTPTEIAFCPSFHRLFHALHKIAPYSSGSLLVVSGVLAHIKEHEGSSTFAAQMATPKPGSKRAHVSGLRFRRLLKISDRTDLYHPLIRTIHLLGGRANCVNLADDIYFWGDYVRKNWAYAYYEKAPSES